METMVQRLIGLTIVPADRAKEKGIKLSGKVNGRTEYGNGKGEWRIRQNRMGIDWRRLESGVLRTVWKGAGGNGGRDAKKRERVLDEDNDELTLTESIV
jgi:hypothetical protein